MIPGRRSTGLSVGIGVLLLALLAPATWAAPTAGTAGGPPYRATVVTTDYGIPHVTATDMASLGYGQGWAAARDNVCLIAERAVTTDGTRSRWFGATQDNVVSDVVSGWLLAEGRVDELLRLSPTDRPRGPSDDARAQVEGYAAGFNRWLDDVGGADGVTDPACAGADWVRPLAADDVWRAAHATALRASTSAFAAGIVGAVPPTGSTAADARGVVDGSRTSGGTDVDRGALLGQVSALDDVTDRGSNAYGLGASTTTSGDGIVLGNPHFPWDGPERFWQSHLTIPGELDVMGASLVGTPGVQIGFNEDVAWSHTVSTARRFAFRQLELVPGDPTSYVVDGRERRMRPVQVPVPDGPTRTVWETDFGPVVVVPSLGLRWTAVAAFALQDANTDNLRTLDQWNAMNRVGSVDELVAVQSRWLGVPWVNTVGADADGQAVFSHVAVTTGVPDELARRCIPQPLQPTWQATGIAVLDGSTTDCDPVADATAPTTGILGPSSLPVLITDDYVTNSNDSHWLSNPDRPLEGFARVLGDERTQRSLRTRLGLVQVEERLAGIDGARGRGFTVEAVQETLFGNRVHGAELAVDELVDVCREDSALVADSACAVLAGWDRRADVDSVGTVLFREFVAAGGLVFEDDFEVSAPVSTPRDLDGDDDRVLAALRTAVDRLRDAGVAIDAALGEVQTERRGGDALPMPGGRSAAGVFNVLNAPFDGADGYPDVVSGASLLLAVEMTDRGPQGEWLLAYSQSADPTSPHVGDQTRLYSREQWVPIVFDRGDVQRAAVDRVRLVGR